MSDESGETTLLSTANQNHRSVNIFSPFEVLNVS